jgi:hypothetical protein
MKRKKPPPISAVCCTVSLLVYEDGGLYYLCFRRDKSFLNWFCALHPAYRYDQAGHPSSYN